MAKRNKAASTLYSSTCIGLDVANETEAKCKKLLDTLGKGKKAFLRATLMYRYPEYFSSGEISPELSALIDKYKRPFERVESDSPTFFGWHYYDDEADKSAHTLLNVTLKGGAKEFIVYVLSSSHPLFFGDDYTQAIEEETDTLATEDNRVIEDRTLDQFNDED